MAKRRANGEGNICKRKDGRWESRYTAGYDSNGRRIIKNDLEKTQAKVKAKLKDAVALAEIPTWQKPMNIRWPNGSATGWTPTGIKGNVQMDGYDYGQTV